ncbi:hypothetical protein AMS68_002732 [Peltaster fructicola]|uniref:Uncharacterized protein n=1 Tax=Peltaster fructicola TaxID=286661 RepID=A0A6H0XRF4_9PEZI|nr:hypothetical protein AMS68_002732 [Peltaster fructicola]
MPGWKDEQQSHRRFPERSRKTGHSVQGESFQPRNMLGRYALRSAHFEKLNARTRSVNEQGMWLEIHGLVESATGYSATFDLGVVSGVMLIAGSRKALRDVVEEADEEEEDQGESSAESEDQSSESDASSEEVRDTFVSAPERDRPAHAFEKNTFRTPKWFAQWRGKIAGTAESSQATQDTPDNDNGPNTNDQQEPRDSTASESVHNVQAHPDNKAHFEFSSAACREFKATFSCPALEAREVAVQGWKITGKASPATIHWSEYAL